MDRGDLLVNRRRLLMNRRGLLMNRRRLLVNRTGRLVDGRLLSNGRVCMRLLFIEDRLR